MLQVANQTALTPFMDKGLASLRQTLKRKEQRAKRKANKKKYKVKTDYNQRADKRHVGEIVMVKTLTSLAPYNYRGQTLYGIPYGTTLPAIRTMNGVHLITMTGRKVTALRGKNEYKELPFVAVPVANAYKVLGKTLPTYADANKKLNSLWGREGVLD